MTHKNRDRKWRGGTEIYGEGGGYKPRKGIDDISAVHVFQSQWIQWGKQEVLFVSKTKSLDGYESVQPFI